MPVETGWFMQTADEAVAESIKSGSRVYVHTGAASPQHLLRSMAKLKGKVRIRSNRWPCFKSAFGQVKDVEVCNMTILGTAYGNGPSCSNYCCSRPRSASGARLPRKLPRQFVLPRCGARPVLSASVVLNLSARLWTAGGNHRQAIKENRGDFVPVFFR